MLVEAMTVFENIILGDKNTKGIFIDREARKKDILELSARYGLDVELDKPITEISVGAQQRVEILKALYRGAELLVLDEPTAALTDLEVEGLFDIIHKLTGEGKSIIFISHKMREVLHISNRITILRAGQTVKTLSCRETCGEELANLMIGRELAPSHYEKVDHPGASVAELRQVEYNKGSKHSGLDHISLTIGRGEIVGIAGVDGNGQSQLAQVITGVLAPDGGELDLKGSRVAKFTPQGFIDEKVSHIPEDRNRMGLVGDMKRTKKHNLRLPPFLPQLAGLLLGAAGGYVYYRLVGCPSGTCPITSNPYLSTVYGGVVGLLFGAAAAPDRKGRDADPREDL